MKLWVCTKHNWFNSTDVCEKCSKDLATHERPSLHEIYMEFAVSLSRRSDCTRKAVGCVVTDKKGTQAYAIGYNGGAAGDTRRCTGEQGQCGCLHAEANALIKCRTHDTEKILYTTVSPCRVCAKLIVNSGFIQVRYLERHRDYDESLSILSVAKVQLIQHT